VNLSAATIPNEASPLAIIFVIVAVIAAIVNATTIHSLGWERRPHQCDAQRSECPDHKSLAYLHKAVWH
jgi:hypothetical protein